MAELTFRDLHPVIGAEVGGFEPSGLPDEETLRTLRKVFDERGLLLFRDLDIDLAFQNFLSQILIGTDPASLDSSVVPDGVREMYVSNKEERAGAPFGRLLFHSDAMWLTQPFQLLSLYGAVVEEPSEPTLFISTTHAWDTLPESLRSRVKDLHAIHTQDATQQRGRSKGDANVLVSTFEDVAKLELPVGHRHPRTGRDHALRLPADDGSDRGGSTTRRARSCWRPSSSTCTRRRTSWSTTGARATWCCGTTWRCSTRGPTSSWRDRRGPCGRCSRRRR